MLHRSLLRNSGLLTVAIATVLTFFLVGCHHNDVYHHFETTSFNGWERTDTLYFHVPSAKADAVLHEEVELRINGQYPFMGLCLVVEQTILPSNVRRVDTLNCSLIDHDGHTKGKGINFVQYNFHLTDLGVSEGDSLSIAIHHNMKRETLPGVIDLGMKLVKN